MKEQAKKKFVITKKVDTTPVKTDIDNLQDTLDEFMLEQNYSHAKFFYNSRVFYFVAEGIVNKNTVNLSIKFRSEDMKKRPDKFGEEFRAKCRAFAWEQANELLDDDKKFMVISITEDWDRIEEIYYERK